MNILFYFSLTFNSQHGGIANVSKILGRGICNKGHRVYYLSAKETALKQVEQQYYLPDDNAFSSRNYEFFKKLINDCSIDVVINQNGTSPHNNECVIWCNQMGLPLVTVLHSCLSGIYGDNAMLKALRLPYIVRHWLSLKFFHHRYDSAYSTLASESDAIVCLSQRFFDDASAFMGKKVLPKLHAIPNPCTLEGCCVMPNKQNKVLYVGRLSEEKQVPLLLEIWSIIENKNPLWELIIVGDGAEMAKCRQKEKELGLQHVRFVGHQDNPTEYYQQSDIFLMTSKFEGFGLTLVEAMVNFIIPIAFNSYANVGDIIKDEECGYLVAPFDKAEYAAKIQYLIDHPEIRRTMAEKARKQSDEFSLSKIVMQWEELLEQVISKKKTLS